MAWAYGKEQQDKPVICICIPHLGTVSFEWAEYTYGPLRFIPQPDFAKTTKLSRGLHNLAVERNLLVQNAMEDKTVSHILFLDIDNICESPQDPNQALRTLLQCDVPIVSGLYRAKKRKGYYPYCMYAKDPQKRKVKGVEGYIPIPKWTGNFISVDAMGLGFCLIRREVFERVPFPWFVWDQPAPSEDFFFCQKAIEYGFDIKVFTDVKLSHAGMMKIKIDSEEYSQIHTMDV